MSVFVFVFAVVFSQAWVLSSWLDFTFILIFRFSTIGAKTLKLLLELDILKTWSLCYEALRVVISLSVVFSQSLG